MTGTTRRCAIALGRPLLLLCLAVAALGSTTPLSAGTSPPGSALPDAGDEATASAETIGATARASDEESSPRPQEPQRLLLGIVVAGQEVDVLEVPFDGREFLLPLDSFLSFCECEGLESRDGLEVVTPLGTGALERQHLVTLEGVRYLRESALVNRLAITVDYDAARLALLLDIPWYGRSFSEGRSAALEKLPIDAGPPAIALSAASVRMRYSRLANQAGTVGGMSLSGRAAGGRWQARYDDAFGDGLLSEYGWLRRFGEGALMLLGHQRVNLHPLLGGLELTGVQGAWTNAPLEIFNGAGDPAELLPRQLRSTTTVRGFGAAAGTAVLRVNDEPIAAQVIGLDGIYEFRNVPVQASYNNRIEVVVYARQNPASPVAINDHSRSASEYILPRGAAVMQGGAGAAGNILDRDASRPASGFYQARYGLSDRLTVEVAAQGQPGHGEAMVGGVAQLGSNVVSSFGIARVDGRLSWLLDGEALAGPWRLTASSRGRRAGADPGARPRESDHQVEIGRRAADGSFEVGLVGRFRRGLGKDVGFVLPAAAWRPASGFLVRARPDLEGRYRFDLSWIPTRSWRVGISRAQGINTIDLNKTFARGLRASLLAETADLGGHRQAAVLTWFGQGRWMPSIAAGPLVTNGRPGALLRAQLQVVPGVLLGLQYESRSLLGSAQQAGGQRLSVSLTSNVMFAGKRVVAGSPYGTRARSGGVAGRLQPVRGYRTAAASLAGVAIRLNGRAVAQTDADGAYYIPNLTPGTYQLRLDPAGLPIELSPSRPRMVVKVVAGAVTRADFPLDVEFGLAGRVRVAGRPAEGVEVELVDGAGVVVARGFTDRFGLYRLDGVERGSYRLRMAEGYRGIADLAWPVRELTLDDDFLFSQDLDLEVGAEAMAALRTHAVFERALARPTEGVEVVTMEVSRELGAAAAAPNARLARLFGGAGPVVPSLESLSTRVPALELAAAPAPLRAAPLRGQ